MSKDFISLFTYLQGDELQVVKKHLDNNRIPYIVNQRGGTIGYEDSDYYEVKVSHLDYTRAKTAVNSFKATRFIKKQKCPKCGSLIHEPVKGLNFFQKIFYMGTTPVRCKKCKTVFSL